MQSALTYRAAGALILVAALGASPSLLAADLGALGPALWPPSGSSGLATTVSITLTLNVAPEIDPADALPPSRLEGSMTGVRADSEIDLQVEETISGSTLTWSTSRPFAVGEHVKLEVAAGWPLADGTQLGPLRTSFRIGSAAMPPPDDETLGADLLFEPVQHLEVGLGPNMAVAADFNRDGAIDLAVSDVLGEDSVHIFLNNGVGRLLAHASYFLEGLDDPGRFTASDVDADGIFDLVVVGQRSGNVGVLLGAADGSFTSTQRIELPSATPVQVEVADLDLDGLADVLVTNLAADSLTRLETLSADARAEGNGSIALIDPIPALPGVQEVAVGDWNGDLRPDLAVVSESTDMIGVLVNSGSASDSELVYQEARAMPVGRRPGAILATDLNGDSLADLLAVQQGSNDVAVLLGAGDGTFGSPTPYGVGDRPVLPALADLNGDGFLDLAVPNLFSDDVSILLGSMDGTFTAAERLPVEAGPVVVAAADFDLDGDMDLAVVHSVADNVAIYSNRLVERDGARTAPEPRSLRQNIPNPFNPSTQIQFTLLAPSHVQLVVFNTSGKVVRTLVDEPRAAGSHTALWDGMNERNENVPSGIYFYRLTTDDTVELRRMTLIR